MSSLSGMKPGERYNIEHQVDGPHFPGFFLDEKYYLSPDLLTAVGWLEDQQFLYDALDGNGEPLFPERRVGFIEDLMLTLHDGSQLRIAVLPVHLDADEAHESQAAPVPAHAVLAPQLTSVQRGSNAGRLRGALGVLMVLGVGALLVARLYRRRK